MQKFGNCDRNMALGGNECKKLKAKLAEIRFLL